MPGSERRRIWIVDDSPLDAERARRVLAGTYDVQLFLDGSAALECLSVHAPPDVMVLDWVMPGISGVEVCRFLRSRSKADAQIGILLLTAHRAVEQIVEGLSAGANDFLAKPYADEELQARVMAQIRARELLERASNAEELNRQLLESAPDAMIAIDAQGRLTFANQEAARMLGQSSAELNGRVIGDFLPSWDGLLEEPTREAFRTLPDVKIAERSYSPVVRLPATATSASVMISLRDVTARRRAEARRLDFYSIIAHDLRSPLNSISLRTQLISGGKHGPLSEGLRADMEKIDKNIQSLVGMINDFLDMARLEHAPIQLLREPVDVSVLLDTTMESTRPLLESSGLSWRRVAPANAQDCEIAADPKRLGQVLFNLLGNAIKFTPAPGTITTSVARNGEHVEVIVADTGPGIAPHELPTLFDRYTRAAAASVAGSGLGLMIVREIVEAHGGSVGVESQLGHGSKFWVRLPIRER